MSTRNEEKTYSRQYNAVPQAQRSAETTAANNALQQAEYDAITYRPNTSTADAKLDQAIANVLAQAGYTYDISKDEDYQRFAQEYSNNALRGRAEAEETAANLSNGYNNTYASAVGSEVANDIASRVTNYAPAFRAAANQEAAAGFAQALSAAQVRGDIRNTEYNRTRDTKSDLKNYMKHLYDRYMTERQADVQRSGFSNDIYTARLQTALNNLIDARKVDTSRYMHDTKSADNTAKLNEDQYEFNKKMAYQKESDAKDDRVAAKQLDYDREKFEKQKREKEQEEKEREERERASRTQVSESQAAQTPAATQAQTPQSVSSQRRTSSNTPAATQAAAYGAMAGEAALSGESVVAPRSSHKTTNIISSLNSIFEVSRQTGAEINKDAFRSKLEELVAKYGLEQDEAAYLYAYYSDYL